MSNNSTDMNTAGNIRLSVETVIGRKAVISVRPTTIVRDIKKIACRTFGIESKQQSLVKRQSNGKFIQLDDSKTTTESGLNKNDRLLLIPIIRTGQDQRTVNFFVDHRVDSIIDRMLSDKGEKRKAGFDYALMERNGTYIILEIPMAAPEEVSDLSMHTATSLQAPTPTDIEQNEATRKKVEALKEKIFGLQQRKKSSAGQSGNVTAVIQKVAVASAHPKDSCDQSPAVSSASQDRPPAPRPSETGAAWTHVMTKVSQLSYDPKKTAQRKKK